MLIARPRQKCQNSVKACDFEVNRRLKKERVSHRARRIDLNVVCEKMPPFLSLFHTFWYLLNTPVPPSLRQNDP